MTQDIEKLKYPVGKFQKPELISTQQIQDWINVLKEFPKQLADEVANLTEEALNLQYRPGGWTIRQVVNHCADSHMNSFIRFKLALTEDTPTIKPYFENLWAELPDTKGYPVDAALKILAGLHERWVTLLENLSEKELERKFIHPETDEFIALKTNLGIYAWHCAHHLAHIKIAKSNG